MPMYKAWTAQFVRLWRICPLRCQKSQHGDDCSTWPDPGPSLFVIHSRTERSIHRELYWHSVILTNALCHKASEQPNWILLSTSDLSVQHRVMDTRSVCKALQSAPRNSSRNPEKKTAQTKTLSRAAVIQTVHLHTGMLHWNQMPLLITWLPGIYSITAVDLKRAAMFHKCHILIDSNNLKLIALLIGSVCRNCLIKYRPLPGAVL